MPRHLTKVTELKSDSESKNKVFLHLNAGGMLGGVIWYPILGSGPVVESIKTLNYNALVKVNSLSFALAQIAHGYLCRRYADVSVILTVLSFVCVYLVV